MSIGTQLRFARLIGRRSFDEAIEVLVQALTGTDADLADIEMIARCHRWAGRDREAAGCAERALAIDPGSFGALSLLAEIHAVRGDDDRFYLALEFQQLHSEDEEQLRRMVRQQTDPAPGDGAVSAKVGRKASV